MAFLRRTMAAVYSVLGSPMTLAWILAASFFGGASSSSNASTLAAFGQSQSSSAQTSASPAAVSPSAQAKPGVPTHKLRHRKKGKAVTHCAADSASATAATPPAAPCPPAKIVVNNGSSPEPSIQLTGPEAPHQNDTAAQLLATTDDNLKKIAALQLTASQQEMVSQIHQFVDQSKAAVTAGDAGRARMLALKAQTLSEELTKPAK